LCFVNLNTHVVFALGMGVLFFHSPAAWILVGIGAALPDLDREFTSGLNITKHQLHRALTHNVFFGLGLLFFNLYLGVGIFLHIGLDLLTSPTDRGVELFFPLGRLIREFEYSYKGKVGVGGEKFLWFLEDPVDMLAGTVGVDLWEYTPTPWRRVYGPFKNSRFVDWFIFYSSLAFLIAFGQFSMGEAMWVKVFMNALVEFWPMIVGVVLFYTVGEVWRRKFHGRVKGEKRPYVLALMLFGLSLVVYRGITLYSPVQPHTPLMLMGVVGLAILFGGVCACIHTCQAPL